MNTANEVAEKLLQINAVKLSPQNPFTWASGIKSPIYCDNRLVLSYPSVRSFVVDAFVAQSSQFAPFDIVAGVATAGIPHGALLADRLEKPFIYVREKAKSHGRQNQIEGNVWSGAKVLVIEDLISTGGSSLKAVETLREVGCEVVGILAIFSYGFQKATDVFAEANCPFDTLSNYDALLKKAIEMNYIAANDLETLQNWRISPSTWGINDK
ncbi:MAG: orotate phosphoribosyltransferase [Saprospiraceae bacterium]|nr:orotate phosphoribosyltransferase [Saprospiraceae bacterium]